LFHFVYGCKEVRWKMSDTTGEFNRNLFLQTCLLTLVSLLYYMNFNQIRNEKREERV
jgi:hypothetical protein